MVIAMTILSVRPSVRASVCQTRYLWQNERFVYIFIPYERSQPSFLRKKWLVGAIPST